MNDQALPLQVSQAGKRSEDLMALHTEGEGPGEEDAAPIVDQDPKDQPDVATQLAALQKKYDVLHGKYKAEIENADLKDLQRLGNENTLLKREISDLKTAMKANEDLVREVNDKLDKDKQQPAAETEPMDAAAILNDEERSYLEAEDLGGKTLEILMKLARVAGGSHLEGQLKNISTQVNDLSKRTEKTETVQHQVTLDSAVPEFAKVNAAKEFHDWLDLPVSEFSQRKNRDDLQDAMNSGDFKTVSAGIKAFKKETGWGQAGEKPKKEKTPHIEPDESFTAEGSEIVKPGKTYTMAQVKQFYEDQTKGRWVGREKEAAAIDRDITLAQTEGRITG